MHLYDEKDYIMRMIKELVNILIRLILGKTQNQTGLPLENKYDLSKDTTDTLAQMIDSGEVNEAENILLDGADYTDRESVARLIFFYEYTGQKTDDFLQQHNYSREEVLEGLKQLAKHMGYQNVPGLIDEDFTD